MYLSNTSVIFGTSRLQCGHQTSQNTSSVVPSASVAWLPWNHFSTLRSDTLLPTTMISASIRAAAFVARVFGYLVFSSWSFVFASS